MNFTDTVRADIAYFIGFIVEEGLAEELYNGKRIEIKGPRWVLSNIAEILSHDGVVCEYDEKQLVC